MKKKSLNFSDLSRKELDWIKNIFVETKLKNMNIDELKTFVRESIDHQIKDTIGEEEEMEAWKEMEDFFKDEFNEIISDTQNKFKSLNDCHSKEINIQKIPEAKTSESDEIKKVDMWED